MKFEHDKIEEIELLHTEALADRLQFLALSERNPKVSLWLSHSADRLQIQLEDNADLRKDSERYLNALILLRDIYDGHATAESIIDAAVRNSQTEEGE